MPDVATPPIEVARNSIPTTTITLIRYGLTALGAWMVTKNILPVGTDVNQIVGVLLIVANAGFGAFTSYKHNEQKKVMEPYAPNSIAKLKR